MTRLETVQVLHDRFLGGAAQHDDGFGVGRRVLLNVGHEGRDEDVVPEARLQADELASHRGK